MINVTQAKEIVQQVATKIKPNIGIVASKDALGLVLAQDLKSKYDSPPFNQSAMDGYLFNYEATFPFQNIPFSNEVEFKTGLQKTKKIDKQHAYRIYTGACLPINADTVIPQENINLENNYVSSTLSKIKPFANVRMQGEQFKKNDTIIDKGTKLNAAMLSVAITAGCDTISVIKKPRINLIINGDELVKSNARLGRGQIFESNSILIQSLITENNFELNKTYHSPDTLKSLINRISLSLKNADVIILTGGISVGKYDFVKQALEHLHVKTHFHKVAQKPGKPVFFGSLGNKLIFALPGNPASAAICFYLYVLPALQIMSGLQNNNTTIFKKLKHSYSKKAGLTHFLKAYYNQDTVTILENQESYKLNSLAIANCLVQLDEQLESIDESSSVLVYPF